MSPALVYNATLTDRRNLTDHLAFFTVRPDVPLEPNETGMPPFLHGQYITVGLKDPNSPDRSVLRPMSMASSPKTGSELELLINRVETPASEMPLTHLLWAQSPGDRCFLRPAATGRFTLQDTIGLEDPRNRVLIAHGTGLAPFLSMIRNETESLEGWRLLHVASSEAALAAKDELTRAQDRGLIYYPVIDPEDVWIGTFDETALEQTERTLGDLIPSKAVVFVCGLGLAIRSVTYRLVQRGYIPPHRRLRKALDIPNEAPVSLFFEQYDSERLFDLKDEALITRLRTSLETKPSP